jgi:hypothetical protein
MGTGWVTTATGNVMTGIVGTTSAGGGWVLTVVCEGMTDIVGITSSGGGSMGISSRMSSGNGTDVSICGNAPGVRFRDSGRGAVDVGDGVGVGEDIDGSSVRHAPVVRGVPVQERSELHPIGPVVADLVGVTDHDPGVHDVMGVGVRRPAREVA